jgi:CHAT domain-containing protein
MSRAGALGQVVAEFRKRGEEFGAPEVWAAFSLTGDWR